MDTRCVLVKSEFGAKELILVGTGEQSLKEKGFRVRQQQWQDRIDLLEPGAANFFCKWLYMRLVQK